jgi:hypothetical protein
MMREVRSVKAEFQISQVVKGSFYLSTVEVALSPNELERLPKEQTVLLFLGRGTTDKEFFIAGAQSEGVKHIAEKELEVYAARLKDLLNITAEKDEAVRNSQLTEWLVQCVEEPVTRRDALDDLLRQQWQLRWQKEAAGTEKEAEAEADEVAGAEVEEEAAEAEPADQEEAETADVTPVPEAEPIANLAALLTAGQKHRLLQILYQASRLRDDEVALIELAEDWGDENFIPFLWSYLKTNQPDEPHVVTELIEQIAKPYPLNEDAQRMSTRYQNAANGISDDEGESDNDDDEASAKIPQPLADPHVLRAEFIKLIESLGAPRLVYIAATKS